MNSNLAVFSAIPETVRNFLHTGRLQQATGASFLDLGTGTKIESCYPIFMPFTTDMPHFRPFNVNWRIRRSLILPSTVNQLSKDGSDGTRCTRQQLWNIAVNTFLLSAVVNTISRRGEEGLNTHTHMLGNMGRT